MDAHTVPFYASDLAYIRDADSTLANAGFLAIRGR